MIIPGPVRRSKELLRILALPVTEEWTRETADHIADTWGPTLLNDEGKRLWDETGRLPTAQRDAERERLGIRLLFEQVQMLCEAVWARGLRAVAAVGAGKTLVTWLLNVLFDTDRPYLLVPGGLISDTHAKFREIAKYWKAPRADYEVLSYELLTNKSHAHVLCNCGKCLKRQPDETREQVEERTTRSLLTRPTFICLDESDATRDVRGSRAKRISRFKVSHVETIIATLSGTAQRWDIGDVAHHSAWALGLNSPYPLTYVDLTEWREATGGKVRGAPRDPGALRVFLEWCPKNRRTGNEIRDIRRGIAERVRRTRGTVITQDQSSNVPLRITVWAGSEAQETNAAFEFFRDTNTAPDGWKIADALSKLKHGAELGNDFYYHWNPRPPDWWRNPFKVFSQFCSEMIDNSQHSNYPLETIAQVTSKYAFAPEVVEWKRVAKAFVPNVEAVPLSRAIIDDVDAWLKIHAPAVVWTQHSEVGEWIERELRIPYYASKGKSKDGQYIGKHDARKSCVMSVHANRKGWNLQAFSRCLFLGWPYSAERTEQAMGRFHRRGQKEPVDVHVRIGCAEHLESFCDAIRECAAIDDGQGSLYKMAIAEMSWSAFPRQYIAHALGTESPACYRWSGAQSNLMAIANGDIVTPVTAREISTFIH